MSTAKKTAPAHAAKTIPWWNPEIGPREYDLVAECLRSNYVNEGALVTDLENRLATMLGSRHAIATSSGTAALFLSLAALGVGHGDEVIVPDITFIATANAVRLAGATPVLVDVDSATLNMSPAAFERAITKRTKAVMPVHVSGRPAALEEIAAIAKKHGIAIVEDSAEGLMSKRGGKCVGTFGKTGILSFSANKTITTGQGGMVFTDDEKVAVRLRELKDQGRPTRGTGGDDMHRVVGYNFKMTNLQAAVGLGQLTYLEHRLGRMRRIYELYAQGLAGLKGIRLYGFDLKDGAVPQWTDAWVERRDELDKHLASHDVHCRRFWHPLHKQEAYQQGDERFPNSTKLCPHSLWLPSAFTLTDEDVARVCALVREFLA